ncbi:MAG: ion channel, partial [Elusimicrobiota bacterium]
MIVKRIIIFISLIFVVLLLGVAGYMSIENLNMLDAFYMTVITLSTVGFKEVVELSKGGMLFTIALIGGG